jgi:hypothetical protein
MTMTPPQAQIQDLLSPDADTAARAADALYALPNAAEIFAAAPASEAVATSLAQTRWTAAKVLLLGYSPKGSALLKELLARHGTEQVKLRSWSRMVPLEVVALAALSRLGDREARARLLAQIPTYAEPARVFLLDILPYIDAPEVWHALSAYLQDTREIPEGVPSGAARRRLCDHAADAFVNHLALPVSFERQPGGRYEAQAIEQVSKLLRQTVPR